MLLILFFSILSRPSLTFEIECHHDEAHLSGSQPLILLERRELMASGSGLSFAVTDRWSLVLIDNWLFAFYGGSFFFFNRD